MNAMLLRRLTAIETALGLKTGNGEAEPLGLGDARYLSDFACADLWRRICVGQVYHQTGGRGEPMTEAEEDLIVAEWRKLKAEQGA